MESVGRAEDPFLEGYTSMGYLAAVTERIPLAMLVTGVTYRYPGLLAKTMSTPDVLSGGRSLFGIGAAWYDREHHGLGIPYPPVSERFEMPEEPHFCRCFYQCFCHAWACCLRRLEAIPTTKDSRL